MRKRNSSYIRVVLSAISANGVVARFSADDLSAFYPHFIRILSATLLLRRIKPTNISENVMFSVSVFRINRAERFKAADDKVK